MSQLLQEYRNWVRANPQTAQQFEQISRLAVFFFTRPTSLLTMELSQSVVSVLGDINQSVFREDEQHTNFNHNNPTAQQVQQKINTSASIVQIIRELQNCGELFVRKMARQYLSSPTHNNNNSIISGPLVVQLYVAAIELTKLVFRMKQNEDIWKIVLPQLFSFEDVTSESSSNRRRNLNDDNEFGGDQNQQRTNINNDNTPKTLKFPHIISDSSSSLPQKLTLSRPDRIGLWLDLIDLIRPLVVSVALVSGSIWHKRKSLHKAWTIWLLGLAYEIIAYFIHNYYLKKRRTAFLRESTGQLIQQLHDRTREQLLGFHFLRYPFFNLIAEPELRKRLLSPGAWVGKIPLLGGLIQGLVEYQIQIQKRCVVYSSGS